MGCACCAQRGGQLELAETVEAHHVALAQAGGNRRLEGIESPADCRFADLRIGRDFAAQISFSHCRGVFRLVIRGVGERLAGLWIAPDLSG